MSKHKLIGISLLGISTGAVASTGDTTFSGIADTIASWTSGSLGKIIAGEALVAGVAYGVVRQNIFSVVISIAAALILNYGPGVLSDISTFSV